MNLPILKDAQYLQAGRYQEILLAVLQQRCLRNPQYSLRAFARDLALSASSLSEIMHGKVRLSVRKAEEIAEKLGLDPISTRYFILLVTCQSKGPKREWAIAAAKHIRREHLYTSINSAHAATKQWNLVHYSLALLAKLKGNICINENLAQQTGLSLAALGRASKDLINSGWLKRQGETSVLNLAYAEALADQMSMQDFQRLMLDHAYAALDKQSVVNRFFFSTIFTLSQAQYQLFCAKLRNFALDVSDDFQNSSEHDSVFALSLQLLPLIGPS